jgi:hypothetical protein
MFVGFRPELQNLGELTAEHQRTLSRHKVTIAVAHTLSRASDCQRERDGTLQLR